MHTKTLLQNAHAVKLLIYVYTVAKYYSCDIDNTTTIIIRLANHVLYRQTWTDIHSYMHVGYHAYLQDLIPTLAGIRSNKTSQSRV